MAYIIYKTNGQQLLTLLDGTLDSSRGVNLVGKNYVNFGTAQNENFVWLLENHANDTPPTYPLTGQLWYDTGTSTLKYFDGTAFNVLSNAAVLSSDITALNNALVANVSNLSSYFSSNVTTLTSNAASQNTQINNLWANAAIQASLLNSLSGLVTGSNIDISAILDSTNARIDSTNLDVANVAQDLSVQTGRIDGLVSQVNDIDDLLSAQTVVQTNQGVQIGLVQSGLTGANLAITASNVAMRSYVDATNGTQTTQINNLSNSVDTLNSSFTSFYSWANLNFGTSNYSNNDVALYLPTYTGNISASSVIINDGVFWANGTPFASSNYSNVNTASYLAGSITTGNISAGNIAASKITTTGVFWANGAPYAPGGAPTRVTISASTGNLAAGANANVTVTGFKGYNLYNISTSSAAWVSVYSNVAARTADYTRSQSTDPLPGTGVLAEVITSGSATQWFSPAVSGYNNESSPTTDVQLRITNTSNTFATITVDLTLLQTES
jgi:hypothetical protein